MQNDLRLAFWVSSINCRGNQLDRMIIMPNFQPKYLPPGYLSASVEIKTLYFFNQLKPEKSLSSNKLQSRTLTDWRAVTGTRILWNFERVKPPVRIRWFGIQVSIYFKCNSRSQTTQTVQRMDKPRTSIKGLSCPCCFLRAWWSNLVAGEKSLVAISGH